MEREGKKGKDVWVKDGGSREAPKPDMTWVEYRQRERKPRQA